MSTIFGVLLIPAEGDPLGLLAEEFGTSPPLAGRVGDFSPWSLQAAPGAQQQALVLVWDKKVSPLGCGRADAVRDGLQDGIGNKVRATLTYICRERNPYFQQDLADLRADLARDGLGGLAFVNASGHEV